MLKDEEVLSLTHVLVRDNESLDIIDYSSGWYGAGNTNHSEGSSSSSYKSVESFAGTPIRIGRPLRDSSTPDYGIAAIVEDVLYLIIEEGYGANKKRKVKQLRVGQSFSVRGSGPAYDTWERFSLTATSKKRKKIKTEYGSYEGNVVRGLPEGQGVYRYNENDPKKRRVCEGRFVEGKMHGYCKVTYRDGARYEGITQNDELSSDYSRARYYFPNGDYYEGYFVDGKMHGNAMIYYSNGRVKDNARWEKGEVVKYFVKDGERV